MAEGGGVPLGPCCFWVEEGFQLHRKNDAQQDEEG